MSYSRLTAYLILFFTHCLLLTVYFLLFPLLLSASDEPFTYPSNWGGPGLMEIPTARGMQENTFRIGISQVKPYEYYYGAISPINMLEIDGRITELLGIEVKNQKFSGYGNYKDKAIDFKYQIIPESRYLPAIALGIMDPHGTRLYSSQYIVASKQIYPFDFTLGIGNGRFGKNPLPSTGDGIAVEMFSDNGSWRQ